MAAQSSLLLPPSLEGGDLSPFPSSPATTDSASGSPAKDFRNEVRQVSTPVGKVPPNSALTTPDMKTTSGASSTEPSPPGSSYGYGEREGDFWSSIQKHYDELMDDGLIEKCKDVESDFSLDEESDSPPNSSVSFTEFLEQYKELSDWLLHLKRATVQTVHSQSEKYLNQSYHEEMLQRSPRRKLFKEYARRLQRRFPNLKEDICARLAHLNRQWKELETQITGRKSDDNASEVAYVDDALRSPVFDVEGLNEQSFLSMSADLEADLDMLKNWLSSVETRLGPLTMRKVQEMGGLEEKLREYQSIQREIESQARVISAVFKLCDRLDSLDDVGEEGGGGAGEEAACSSRSSRDDRVGVQARIGMTRRERKGNLRSEASVMENRWHKVWLLALEWQCCLEERLSRKVVHDFSLSPYLNKTQSLPPNLPRWRNEKADLRFKWEKGSATSGLDLTTTTTMTTTMTTTLDHESKSDAAAAPGLEEGRVWRGSGPASVGAATTTTTVAPETAHVSVGTENVCKCGFMGDQVCADATTETEGAVESAGEPPIVILCSRCKRPTKDSSLDAANLERDVLLSAGNDDDRAIQELVRLFDKKDPSSVLHKQRRAQQRLAEPHDIGYSSEGLSNDEDSSIFSPRVLAPRDTGLDTLSEAPKHEQDVIGGGGDEAPFFPPAALEVFHVHDVDAEERRQLQHVAEAPNDAMERLRLKYGLGVAGNDVSLAAESSDFSSSSCGAFRRPGLDNSRNSSLGGASAATDLDQTETDPLEKTPPRHRKSLVRRDSIQKLVLEVEDLIAHERDKNGGDEDGDDVDDSTLTRKNRRRRALAFPSEEAGDEFTTSTENDDLGASLDGERNHRAESSGSRSSDWDFNYHDGSKEAAACGGGSGKDGGGPSLNVTVRSVTEMYEQSLGVDLSPFAIDDDDDDGARESEDDAVDGVFLAARTKIHNNVGDTRVSRSNFDSNGFHPALKVNAKSHKKALSWSQGVATPPQPEEFYISDQVWEYEDFSGDVSGRSTDRRGRERLSPTFIANHDDDFRFRPTSTDDVDDDDDAISDRRRSDDASLCSTPPLAPPPNFLFKPLAAAQPPPQHRDDDEDSDSDCEELRHVLEESRAQLQVTDVTLGKIKREMIEKGNFLEPSKYKELLATCQTNIKCLQVIHQHLKTPHQTSIPDNVEEIEEIIERWEVLQAVTADKQSRCRALKELSAQLMNVVEFRDEVAAALASPCRADGIAQLDAFVFELRNCFYGIAEHRVVLRQTRDGLTEFADSNPRYSVQRMRDSVDVVDEELERLGRDFEGRIAELEALHSRWADAGEKLREVVFGIRDLRRPGKILRRAASKIICGDDDEKAAASPPSEIDYSQSEVKGIEEDDRALKKRALLLEEDLDAIERSCRCIESVASEGAVEKLAAHFDSLRREISALKGTEWIVEEEGFVDESETSDEEAATEASPFADKEPVLGRPFHSRIARSTKFVLVGVSVLALLLGLALVISPDCCFTRNTLKWSLQPQLRYSDGPPPQ